MEQGKKKMERAIDPSEYVDLGNRSNQSHQCKKRARGKQMTQAKKIIYPLSLGTSTAIICIVVTFN